MSDSTPSFVQVLTSTLFVMPSGNDNVGWCAYLLGRGETPPDMPITIEDSFRRYGGHYLFALFPPPMDTIEQVDTFIRKVREHLDKCFGPGFGQPFNGRACLWIPDPVTLGFGTCGGYSFPFSRGLSAYVLDAELNNPMGTQLTFAVRRSSTIANTPTGLVIGGAETRPASFITTTAGQGPSISPGGVAIPLVGPYSGCFLISGTIDTSVTLAYFEAGLRYTHVGSGSAVQQRYPMVVTSRPGTVFPYFGAVDPLDPANRSATTVDGASGRYRTLLAPVAGSSAPTLASWLRTVENKSLGMVPVGGGTAASGPTPNSAALVFEYAGTSPAPGASGPLYLTFAGDFGLALAATAQGPSSQNLLCGLFGSETMSFRPYNPTGPFDRLRFIAGKAAYAPVFPFVRASLNDTSSGSVGARLTPEYRTSWGMMVDGESGDTRYMAQPEGSPLFTPGTSTLVNGVSVLDPLRSGVKLPNTPGFAVPLAPYAGVSTVSGGFGAEDLGTFESQIISPTRKSLISDVVSADLEAERSTRRAAAAAAAANDGTEAGGTPNATTPQGLLAEVVEGSIGADYVSVILARSESSAGTTEMAFRNLQLPLQSLFQTNQLFAVVVDPTFLGSFDKDAVGGAPIFDNTITIAEWRMAADVGEGVMATDYRNVMIFKFCDGTVTERVASPNKWAQPEQFSLAPGGGDPALSFTGLSTWLQDFIAGALVEADERKNYLYANFANIVTDPNWNGVLVLRADVKTLPDQIKGLAAGIDFTQFEAHHFGVTTSRVTVQGGTVTMDGPSSMFGLIDYQYPLFRQNQASGADPNVPLGIPVDGVYGFTVLQLQALFRNTALVDFRSRVQLTINAVFDSKVLSTYGVLGPSIANGVVLKGSYQTQGETSTYVFEQTRRTVFTVDSNAFNAISFDRVQFNTLTPDTGGDDPNVVSRFLIWGTFDFARLTGTDGGVFDALSFGTPTETPIPDRGYGLSFSNLQITMTSPVDTPNAVLFNFNAAGLAFNMSTSVTRAGSLFPTFALQIDSFIASNGEKRPAEMGYLSVGAALSLASISGPWFGVVYKVTMGTPGALVSGAGFESKMLIAWSPQSTSQSKSVAIFLGLQLPGAAPGAKLLSLQGVLKVSVSSIQLTYDPVTGSDPPAKAFNLRLSNIGLKFLGIVKLPPNATINFFLFGDPGGTGSLGWYAAYIENQTTALAALGEGQETRLELAENAGA